MKVRVVEILSGPIEGGIPTTIRSRLKYAPSDVTTLLVCPFTSWIEEKAGPESFPCDVMLAEPGLRGARTMVAELRRFQPGMIIAHTERDLWWALSLRALARVRCPITYVIHNDVIDARPIIRSIVPLSLRVAALLTDRVIAVAGETRDGEQGRNFTGVVVCHQPPDLPADGDLLSADDGQGGPVFLIAKRLVPSKGVDRFLAGVAIAQDSLRSQECRIIIAGDGPQRESLESQVQKSGIQDLVTFRGWTNEVARDFLLADYFVQPSIHEGASMSLVEAMHAGLRVASSPKGLAKDVLGDDPDSTLFDLIPSDVEWAQWLAVAAKRPRLTASERRLRAERSHRRFDPKGLTQQFYAQILGDLGRRSV